MGRKMLDSEADSTGSNGSRPEVIHPVLSMSSAEFIQLCCRVRRHRVLLASAIPVLWAFPINRNRGVVVKTDHLFDRGESHP